MKVLSVLLPSLLLLLSSSTPPLLAADTDLQQLCGIPSTSPFAQPDANCTCRRITAATTNETTIANCNGGSGIELNCAGLVEFYQEEAQFPNITCLVIKEAKFTSLNSNHTRQFPNLIGLEIVNSRLDDVRSGAFDHLERLQFIKLDGNRLTIFPRISHQDLRVISIRNNMIEDINQKFDNLPRLTRLHMDGNRLRELRNGMFEDNCYLDTVHFSDNPLERISHDAFTGAQIQHLFLINTQVSHLPTQQQFREQLETLDLTGAYNFKEFQAFNQSGDKIFPLLKTVSFPYHAHCCQIIQSNFTYQGIPPPPSTPTSNTLTSDPTNATDLTNTTEVVLCVNHTSQQCYNDTFGFDLLDEFLTTFVNTTAEICEGCVPCVRDRLMCRDQCDDLADQGVGSGMGGGVITGMGGDLVTCLVRTEVTVPLTPCNDSSNSEDSSDRAECVGVRTGNVLPPTAPPLPMCSANQYCRLIGNEPACYVCIGNCMLTHQHLPPEEVPMCGEYPGFCSCLREPDSCGCDQRRRRRRRREAMFLTPYEQESPLAGGRRGRRESGDMDELNNTVVSFPCGHDESQPFVITKLDGFFEEVTCRKVLVANESIFDTHTFTPTSDIICPTRLNLADTVDMGRPPTCSPESDPFNPCVDLLGEKDHLRIAIWFVVIFALLGNLVVLVVFVGYSVIVRRTKQEGFVVHFLYSNLAMADFLMGVYLLIIASEDISTKGRFYVTDIKWRTGHLCGFAGFCAITSTVVSVYVLMVITLERTYTIVRVLSRKKLNKTKAAVVMAVGWVLGFFVAMLPLVHVSDYSSVAVCLPFETGKKQDMAYVILLLLSTGLSFLVIAVCYGIILQQILCNRRKSSPYQEARKRLKGEFKVALRIFILVFTNLACWFPIALVGLSAAFGDSLVTDLEFARWAIVFIFPINACLNPILYSFTTRAFRENFVLLFNKCGLFDNKAKNIRHAQIGLSTTSKTSDTSGINRVRSTVVMKFRSLSITSQSSTTDLMSRFAQRRASTLSTASSEDNPVAYLNTRRRLSGLSTDSILGPGMNRARSDSTFSGDSDDPLINPGFRTSSPEGANGRQPSFDRSSAEALRSRCKVSASSLGAVPEENEIPMEVIGDQNGVVKVNPAFCEGDEEPEVGREGVESRGVVTNWESQENQRDSGCVEGSENEEGVGSSEEASIEVNPVVYQLQTAHESSPPA